MDSETKSILLETIRRFVDERLRPLEAKVAEDDAIPEDVLKEMSELGLYGLSIPEEYGGLGLNMEEECLVALELGRCSPAFRSAFGTNVGIGSQGLLMYGTDAQKKKYLPAMATGEIVTSFALTEPDVGSDSGSVKTSARLEGDHYVLNGTKRYITNANRAHLFTVIARTNKDTKDASGLSTFLVERSTPGLTVGKPEKKMGQHGTNICDVTFDNVKVPVENMIGEEGQGFKVAMQVLDRGRLHISSFCVGIAERLIDDSVQYASEREQFGKPISSFQLIQAHLAESRVESYAGRCMALDAAKKYDQGLNVSEEAACSKLFASEMVGRVADRAVQIFGGAGYLTEYGVERFYRDVRLFRIYEGTSEIQKIVIARHMLKKHR